MKPTRDRQRAAATFFLSQAAMGFALGVLVAATMLATNAAGLWSLVASNADAFPAVIAFVLEFGCLFAALMAGAATSGADIR